MTIGPWTERGFFYDFDMPAPLTEKDLPKIRKEMQRILRKNLPFVREEVSAAEARSRIEVRREELPRGRCCWVGWGGGWVIREVHARSRCQAHQENCSLRACALPRGRQLFSSGLPTTLPPSLHHSFGRPSASLTSLKF